MKLLGLRVAGFGPLQGEFTFDPDRVTLLVDENERGKTSLLHAVVAGLYGLERDGRRYRGLFTPLEQEVGRALSHRRSLGQGGKPLVAKALVVTLILVVAVVAALALPGAASAHATLSTLYPDYRERLDRPPKQVVLRFNQAVDPATGPITTDTVCATTTGAIVLGAVSLVQRVRGLFGR